MTPEEFVQAAASRAGLSASAYQTYHPSEAWQLKNRLWQGKARSQRFELGFVVIDDDRQIDTAVSNSMARLAPPEGGFNAVAMVERVEGAWSITKVVEKAGTSIGVRLKPYFPKLEIIPVSGPVTTKPGIETSPVVETLVQELVALLSSSPNLILQGPPGTGKSFLAQKVCEHLAEARDIEPFQLSSLVRGENGNLKSLLTQDWFIQLPLVWERVQLHPGYTYDDFVRGRALITKDGGSRVDSVDKMMLEVCAVAAARGDRPTLLILEEINRCNLASVLGDLIVAIDPAHRGEAVHLQVSPPSDGGIGIGALLAIPPSLRLLGTMNTADRSIALVDYAIRRRFRFADILPDREVIVQYYEVRGAPNCGVKAAEMFDKILGIVSDERIQLGQSFFLCEPGEGWAGRFANKIMYEIFPMLREYESEGRHLEELTLDLGAHGQIEFGQQFSDPADKTDRDRLATYLST